MSNFPLVILFSLISAHAPTLISQLNSQFPRPAPVTRARANTMEIGIKSADALSLHFKSFCCYNIGVMSSNPIMQLKCTLLSTSQGHFQVPFIQSFSKFSIYGPWARVNNDKDAPKVI